MLFPIFIVWIAYNLLRFWGFERDVFSRKDAQVERNYISFTI